jgi:hypothetical protein
MRSWLLRLCTVLAVLMLGVGLYGQATGEITGTVTDKSGAGIPGAAVTISAPDRGFVRHTTTNSTGNYSFPALIYGNYDLAVSAKGFQTYSATGIVLESAEMQRVNVVLNVGEVSQTVNVQGSSIAKVELENATVGSTVNATQVKQLELNGRNFSQLIALVPGVVNTGETDAQTVGVYEGIGSYNVNGGRGTENDWEVDGANVEDNGSNGTLNVYPSIDAVDQVRVLSSDYGAQYSRDASATVLVSMKHGTNQWHGDAYDFLRNEAMNARNYFQYAAGPGDHTGGRSPYRKNDFGFTVGGPIIKDKTFIFWSSEWRRESQPNVFNNQVPSAQDRAGNFSDVCPGSECPKDPTTGLPYPGNIVPINPNAGPLLTLIPAPNSGGPGNWRYFTSVTTPTDWYESLFRIDQNLGDKWHIYYQFIHDSWNTVVPTTLWDWANFPTVQTKFAGPGVAMVAHVVTTLSPTLTNEFIGGYTADHIALNNVGPDGTFNSLKRPASFTQGGIYNNGFNGIIPGVGLCCSADANFGESTGDEPWFNSNPTYTIRDQINTAIGGHILYFGGEGDLAQKNEMAGGYLQGFDFFCGGCWSGSTGNAMADMFIGAMNSFNQVNVQPKYYDVYKTGDFFLQDDWHYSPRLTINMGFQLDLMGGYYDTAGLDYNFVPGAYVQGATTIDPATTVISGNPYNGLLNCGKNGVTQSCNNNHLFNYSPRIGFAYDLSGDGKTSLRGGYGIFYDHTNSNDIIDALRNPPGQLNPTVSNISNAYSAIGGAGVQNFPLGISAIPTTGLWPMVQQWNLNIQHQLASHFVGQIAYVGSKGTHLMEQMNLDQLTPAFKGSPYAPGGALAGQPLNCTDSANPYLNGGGIPPRSLMGTANQWQVNEYVACGNSAVPFVPYVGYGGISLLTPGANSNYNSMQVSAHGNFGGLYTSLAYTWAHALDDSSSRYDGSFVNSYDLHSLYASSGFDQRQNLSMSWVYDLPFMTHNSWLGGWQWSGMMMAFTGTPFTATNNTTHGNNAGVDTPAASGTGSFLDVVGNPNLSSPAPPPASPGAGPQYYNPAAFAVPVGLTFGNEGRNFLRNPGLWNFDMGLFKNFKVTESQSLQLRLETFNTFNAVNWTGLDGGINDSTFLRPTGAHDPRIMQIAAKYVF